MTTLVISDSELKLKAAVATQFGDTETAEEVDKLQTQLQKQALYSGGLFWLDATANDLDIEDWVLTPIFSIGLL